jgi:beta-glucosidase-like glycosyl hydrolase
MELTNSLQDFAIEEIGIPLFIMSDEEPESASRFEYKDSKLLKDLYVDGVMDEDLLNHDIQKLSEMGINVALAPVLDYPFNKESFTRYRLPPINTEQELNAFNNSFIDALKQNNIDSTLKHFPGLGMIEQDVHFPTDCNDYSCTVSRY